MMEVTLSQCVTYHLTKIVKNYEIGIGDMHIHEIVAIILTSLEN